MSNPVREDKLSVETNSEAETKYDEVRHKGALIVPILLLVAILLVFLATTWNPPSGGILGPDLLKLLQDIPHFLEYQITVIFTLILFSIIPGIAGLSYRRSFWRWFLSGFAILFFVNNLMVGSEQGGIGSDLRQQVGDEVIGFYLFVEMVLILLLLATRLRRHSSNAISSKAIRQNLIGGGALVLLSILWYVAPAPLQKLGPTDFPALPYQILLLLVGATILFQSFRVARHNLKRTEKSKNIVICLDGTWNEPGTTDFGESAETNVLKLFKVLKGKSPLGKRRKHYHASRCKLSPRQIAFYYHGVGNRAENSALGQKLGGAFGFGASGIVDRAYLDLALVYRPGDRIFIVGFSRGAAIARLLAGAIGVRSIPLSLWTLRMFGRHWVVSKSSNKFLSVKVDVLGCWDTVGAFGIAKNLFGIPFQQMNLLKDLTVSLCVKRAYHMVALDEYRDAFVPSLMQSDPVQPQRITEVWFSGDHSNVGGGHATRELSDITLDFLLRHVSSDYDRQDQSSNRWGLFLAENFQETEKIRPDVRGALRRSTGAIYSYAPRKLPQDAVLHDTVFERMKVASPLYIPESLFNLNRELIERRKYVGDEVEALVQTSSFTEHENQEVQDLSKRRLKIKKWSDSQSGLETDLPSLLTLSDDIPAIDS